MTERDEEVTLAAAEISPTAVHSLLAELARIGRENRRLRAALARAWCRDAEEHFGRAYTEACGT